MVAWIQLSASGHSYREFSVHWCEQGSLSLRRMSESRQRLNRCRLACVLALQIRREHDPGRGCSPCAPDCTGRLTVGMMSDLPMGKRGWPRRSRRTAAKQSIATSSLIPRRASTLTASSTFAGSDQFCVNAIASLSYNRVRPRTSCGNSAQYRSVFGAKYFLNDRRIGGREIQKRTYCLNDIRCGATIGSSVISAD